MQQMVATDDQVTDLTSVKLADVPDGSYFYFTDGHCGRRVYQTKIYGCHKQIHPVWEDGTTSQLAVIGQHHQRMVLVLDPTKLGINPD